MEKLQLHRPFVFTRLTGVELFTVFGECRLFGDLTLVPIMGGRGGIFTALTGLPMSVCVLMPFACVVMLMCLLRGYFVAADGTKLGCFLCCLGAGCVRSYGILRTADCTHVPVSVLIRCPLCCVAVGYGSCITTDVTRCIASVIVGMICEVCLTSTR